MKKLLISTFLICFIFSSALSANQNTNWGHVNAEVGTEKEFPNIFRPIGNFFKRLAGKRRRNVNAGDGIYGVKNVTLSQTELTAACEGSKETSDNALIIEVISESFEPDKSNITHFNYKISSGKIIEDRTSNAETMEQKAKAFWDLSGVKPGTYTIKVEVDNGCPSCVPSITKEIKISDCLNTTPF